ncbi:ADP-ribosylhydrolase ARH1-like isoform X2 [Hemicordylus capensis]|uniref:ADP-ribosylhydrolase ARH1-like isoform X2 n=1 Tax=Hemicordylus capensis TaxID=884348 RepID=UPI002302B823|nr:ADP-ribosylhydrolase ARH1-like isoform X2 [Hemicordylus capensis]
MSEYALGGGGGKKKGVVLPPPWWAGGRNAQPRTSSCPQSSNSKPGCLNSQPPYPFLASILLLQSCANQYVLLPPCKKEGGLLAYMMKLEEKEGMPRRTLKGKRGGRKGSVTAGYLGALAAALFTAYAVQRLPLERWGSGLLKTVPVALEYVQATAVESDSNVSAWAYFQEKWEWYLSDRGLADGRGPARFPPAYSPAERDVIYKTFSLDGWAGRSGHDAPMIAYNALLSAGDSWEKLCSHAMFHGGDSDSTGVIAACCWGIAHGFSGVPEGNHMELEYRDRMVTAADQLYDLAWGQRPV